MMEVIKDRETSVYFGSRQSNPVQQTKPSPKPSVAAMPPATHAPGLPKDTKFRFDGKHAPIPDATDGQQDIKGSGNVADDVLRSGGQVDTAYNHDQPADWEKVWIKALQDNESTLGPTASTPGGNSLEDANTGTGNRTEIKPGKTQPIAEALSPPANRLATVLLAILTVALSIGALYLYQRPSSYTDASTQPEVQAPVRSPAAGPDKYPQTDQIAEPAADGVNEELQKGLGQKPGSEAQAGIDAHKNELFKLVTKAQEQRDWALARRRLQTLLRIYPQDVRAQGALAALKMAEEQSQWLTEAEPSTPRQGRNQPGHTENPKGWVG